MPAEEREIHLDLCATQVLSKKGYVVEKLLNRGVYGEVYRGENRNIGKPVAIKIMYLEAIGLRIKRHYLPRELATLMTAKHANLVHVHDVIFASTFVFIFMEFADGGDMTAYVKKNGPTSEPKAALWFGQVASALHYLHREMRIAHRDIKLEQFLLFNRQKVAKLSDFGFAAESWNWKKNQPVLADTWCGTPPYYSPQILKYKPYNPFATDCWSFGVALFAILNDRYPFHAEDSDAQYREQTDSNFLSTRYIKQFSADLVHLQTGLLTVDESQRMDIDKVVNHPWICRGGK